jgi:hypothetical protein
MSNSSLPTFKGLAWHEITGHGKVAAVELREECPRGQLVERFKHVVLDGKVYFVRGVESWGIPMIPKGATIGLLIDESQQFNWVGREDAWNSEPHAWTDTINEYRKHMHFEGDWVWMPKEQFQKMLSVMWMLGKED